MWEGRLMNQRDAELMAIRLIEQHLPGGKWTFQWTNSVRNCGLCRYHPPTILLSRQYVTRNPEPLVRNTVLHEIAHALAGSRAGHGPEWKQVCRTVGCLPKRLNHSAVMPTGKWRATCGGCDRLFSRHRRPPAGRIYFCPKCGRDKGLLRFSRRGA